MYLRALVLAVLLLSMGCAKQPTTTTSSSAGTGAAFWCSRGQSAGIGLMPSTCERSQDACEQGRMGGDPCQPASSAWCFTERQESGSERTWCYSYEDDCGESEYMSQDGDPDAGIAPATIVVACHVE